MEFNEKKAKEIIKQYGLADKTLRVWKSRNKIPDRYLKENFVKPTPLSKADKILQKRILEILNTGKINQSVLMELCGIRVNKYVEVKNGKVNFNPNEIIKIKSEFNRIRIEIAKAFQTYSERKLRDIFDNPILKYAVILKNIRRSEGYDQVSYFKRGKHPNPKQIWLRVRDEYIIFAMKLRI